jgi:hypothetical protein
MKTFLILSILIIFAISFYSCNSDVTGPAGPHTADAVCGNCHAKELSQWADPQNLHSASTADVLTNVDHNTAELLNDDCLKCHSTFQFPLGVAHFVTPINQTGPWTALNAGDWKATNCQVCHDPTSTFGNKLAKYGSLLDGQWSPSYTSVLALPVAYQKVISLTNGDTSTYIYPDQTKMTIQATRLCNSCHDPADQGSDPEIIINGINYGPQGGDSRAYVAANHQGFGCTDCHTTHNFMPVDPAITSPCIVCHMNEQTGKVHINHL